MSVVVGAGITACGDLEGVDSSDELYDFAETTSAEPADPYERYLLVTDASGIDPMDLRAADERSAELCETSAALPDPSRWSPNDVALIRAYCPEVELDAGG